jgi:hypothetical protein
LQAIKSKDFEDRLLNKVLEFVKLCKKICQTMETSSHRKAIHSSSKSVSESAFQFKAEANSKKQLLFLSLIIIDLIFLNFMLFFIFGLFIFDFLF